MSVAAVRRRSLTIVDVAACAGVSTATVSRVMNARYGVAASTALRVREVIEGMGFEPSLAAQRLRGTPTREIGFVFSILDKWAGEVLKGVSSAAAGSGYRLLAYTDGGASTAHAPERRGSTGLGNAMVAGAILLAPATTPNVAEIPLVAVMKRGPSQGVHVVRSDDAADGFVATGYLLELGHRRIAYVGRKGADFRSEHEAGYGAALRGAGIWIDPAIVSHPVDGAKIAQALHALLALAEPPTAVVAADDELGLAVLSAAAAQGIAVPQDLSIVGSGNRPTAALAEPGLTSVSQRPQELGAQAFWMLHSAIASVAGDPRELVVPGKLVVRSSTERR